MIEHIFLMVGLATLIAIIQGQEWYELILNKLKINFKPFNCPLCLTYWLSFIQLTLWYGFIFGLLVGAINALISEMIYRKIMNMI